MRFEQYLVNISEKLGMEDGEGLANCLSRFGTHVDALYANLTSKTVHIISKLSIATSFRNNDTVLQREGLSGRYMSKFASPWDEICIAHCLVFVSMKNGNMYSAYSEQATLVK